jgi:hypothetical protein
MAAKTPSAGNRFEDAAPGPLRSGGIVRMLVAWLVVAAAAAFGLRVADAVPRVALGVPRRVTRAASIAELERATGWRMPVPAYYPDSLAWPPVELRMHAGGSAAIWCRQRPAGGIAMILASAPPAAGGVAAALLPDAVELQREEAVLGPHPALVSRVRDADGAVWQQVQWRVGGRIILIRYRGTLDQLLKMAGSIRE